MSWAKGDDLYDDKPKIKKAWRLSGYAVGLHWMAVTASCRHDSDGLVDPEWLAERLAVIPKPAARKAIETLVVLNLFEPLAAGEVRLLVDSKGNEITVGPLDEDSYIVHDYLEYNDSSLVLRARREKDAARKAAGGRNGRPPDSTRTPRGIQADSESPDPTRPDQQTPPRPPQGGRQRDKHSFGDQQKKWAAWLIEQHGGDPDPGLLGEVLAAENMVRMARSEVTNEAVVDRLRRRNPAWPDKEAAA